MLRVYNLPPEPGMRDWLRENGRLIAALIAWSVVMVCSASVVAPLSDTEWDAVRTVENGLIYERANGEHGCLARVAAGDAITCGQGKDLTGKLRAD